MRPLLGLLLTSLAAVAVPPVPAYYDDAAIRGAQFIDSKEGWACGDDGVVWHTIDGGKAWDRQKTGTRASLRGLHFLTPYTGFVAGRTESPHGSAGVLLRTDDGGMTWTDCGVGYLPGLDGVRFENEKVGRVWGDTSPTFPKGEFSTKDGGQSWATAADTYSRSKVPTTNVAFGPAGELTVGGKAATLTIPDAARGCLEFRAGCAVGSNVWVVGRPGSVVFHSPDAGATWKAYTTGSAVPLHAIAMHSASAGVAVGDLGTILQTNDGGRTWDVVKTGGQRAAVLTVSVCSDETPVDLFPIFGLKDGYLCVAATLAGPENPTFAAAVRAAGGAASDTVSAAADLRRCVMMLRMWKPDVLVATNAVVLEAVKLAADAAQCPEQIASLGLTPHAVKKVYSPAMAGKLNVPLDEFDSVLADSPRAYAFAANDLLRRAHFDAYTFNLVSSSDPAAANHKTLLEGCDLARGGTARRKNPLPFWTPEYIAQQKKRADDFAALRKLVMAATDDAPLAQAGSVLKELPDPVAAEAVLGLAVEAEVFAKLTLARELYTLLATRYPTYPQAATAMRWLAVYHASGEHLRRLELALVPTYRPGTFLNVPLTAEGTIQVAFAEPANRKIRFRSLEAERGWLGAGLDHEAKLFALDAQALRDPRVQLQQNAARLRLGLNADAERALAAYYAGTFRGVTGSPWADAVSSELWLANRGTAAKPAKPLTACVLSNNRPHLDGKLDDACWATAVGMLVNGPTGYGADVKFAADNEYLYIGVTCRRPNGLHPEKEARRGRDADLRDEDHVQILLDLDRDYSTYYRLCVDCRGRVADDCTGDANWSPNWFVAVEPKDGSWTAELAIPFAELTGKTPRATYCWAVNAVRVVPKVGAAGWSSPAAAAVKPEGFGLLEFRK